MPTPYAQPPQGSPPVQRADQSIKVIGIIMAVLFGMLVLICGGVLWIGYSFQQTLASEFDRSAAYGDDISGMIAEYGDAYYEQEIADSVSSDERLRDEIGTIRKATKRDPEQKISDTESIQWYTFEGENGTRDVKVEYSFGTADSAKLQLPSGELIELAYEAPPYDDPATFSLFRLVQSDPNAQAYVGMIDYMEFDQTRTYREVGNENEDQKIYRLFGDRAIMSVRCYFNDWSKPVTSCEWEDQDRQWHVISAASELSTADESTNDSNLPNQEREEREVNESSPSKEQVRPEVEVE